MDQMSFAEAEYQNKKRKTRREKFLERVDSLIPWPRLVKKLKRHYHKGRTGRPPYPLETMLRIHCMQLFYNLSDPGMEDALYEIESMRRFAGLRLSDRLPDETTILNFRRFLEQRKLGKKLFDEINGYLNEHELMLREGSIVDASIVAAPSSTKNQKKERDPEMHQTRKGNQWHFGMKVHIGVDDEIGLIHSLETTPANTHDLEVAEKLLHGQEPRVFGDAGYRGIEKREAHQEREVDWYIAERPGKRKMMDPDSWEAKAEKLKSQIRAKVEHPFRYMKQVFGYNKVRYRGQDKNRNRFQVMAGLTNLLIAEKLIPT
ncbi:IS5 family transposase [Wenzhouxiangella sp. AB-CW3]|uniref:IS5 family transposase n=1 Tax=Wenzhouxiangella sp. AB-CW3 TaxID=2771012 RepID=UPI001CC279C7|nr:IS5 family transposase [Wenzhouxiangella sp. AB-CW3]